MNLDDRLSQASTDLHMAVNGRDPKPIAAVAKHHNMMRFAAASVALVTATAAVGFIAVENGGNPELPPASQPAQGTSTTLSGPTTTTTQQQPPVTDEVSVIDLSSIDVSAAVAPFDHESNVESMLLEIGIQSVWNEKLSYIGECMAGVGFDGPKPVVLPRRDDPFLISNMQFPPTDLLATEGFALLPGVPSSPDDFVENPERDAATFECTVEGEALYGSDGSRASELYGTIRSAWEEVLTDIDSTVEVRAALGEFSSCLAVEDIPDQHTDSLERYLGYVDSLLMAADDDSTEMRSIHEEYGKLYAECGRELFDTREELRSGDQRISFLDDHSDEIRELTNLIDVTS